MAEELKAAMELKLYQSTTANLSLEKELKVAHAKIAELEAELKKKLHSMEILIKEGLQKSDEALAQKAEVEKKADRLEQRVELVERRAELAEQRALQAVEEYKKSATFDKEMNEAGVESYNIGFGDCLKKVKEFYPDLDISKVTLDEIDEDEVNEQIEDVFTFAVDDSSESISEVVDLVPASKPVDEDQL